MMTKKKRVSGKAAAKSAPKKQGKKPSVPPPPPPPPEGSISEIAASHGVSRTVVNRLIEVGGEEAARLFPKDKRGRRAVSDFERARAWVGTRLQDPPKLGRPPNDSASSPEFLQEDIDFEDPESWPRDLDGLRVVREWWIARLAKRKDDIAAGELVRAEDIRRELFTASRTIRDQLLKIPDGSAADVAAEVGASDVEVVRKIIRASIERALADLATVLQAVATPPATPDEALA